MTYVDEDRLAHLTITYWSKLVPLAKSHGIDPWNLICIRDFKNYRINLFKHPDFEFYINGQYTIDWSMAIKDGIPIFPGDIVYDKESLHKMVVRRAKESTLTVEFESVEHEERTWRIDVLLDDIVLQPIAVADSDIKLITNKILKCKQNDPNFVKKLLKVLNSMEERNE